MVPSEGKAKGSRFCVMGAGHGGLTMAGHLGVMGFDVHLWNRSPQRIEPVCARGGVRIEGEVSGFGTVAVTTTEPSEALEGCDVVMVVVPAVAHRDIARVCAPHLTDGQTVVLNPGRMFGALEFEHALRTAGCEADVIVAEAQALLYACRATGPGQARILGTKNSIPVASIRAHLIPQVLEKLQPAFPVFVPGDTVLKTSLNNIGSVFHPALMLLNAAWVEASEDFEFYHEGSSRSVCEALEILDQERVAVAAAMGIQAMTAREWLYFAYSATGKDLCQTMQANPGYRGIKAPRRLTHRYITEDVPTSLVPLASLGAKFGQPTPTMTSLITMANVMNGEDYFATGRTVERLGLQDMTLEEIRAHVIGVSGSINETPPAQGRAEVPPYA